MKKLLQNLSNLIKVKTMVTAAVMLVFCILALKGSIDADSVMLTVTSVIAFYFGTQSQKQADSTKGGEKNA